MAFLAYFCGLFKASERFANSDRSIIKDEGIYPIVFRGYCSNVRSSLKGRIEAVGTELWSEVFHLKTSLTEIIRGTNHDNKTTNCKYSSSAALPSMSVFICILTL